MATSITREDSDDRRRFWVWLVAAVLALMLLFAVLKWTMSDREANQDGRNDQTALNASSI